MAVFTEYLIPPIDLFELNSEWPYALYVMIVNESIF